MLPSKALCPFSHTAFLKSIHFPLDEKYVVGGICQLCYSKICSSLVQVSSPSRSIFQPKRCTNPKLIVGLFPQQLLLVSAFYYRL